MINISIILLFTAIISIIGSIIIFLILSKVYQEKYKRPWIFIAISTIFFAGSNLIRFLLEAYGFKIYNQEITAYLDYLFGFIAMMILVYGLLLELMILKYYKGKFVKMKLIPVQEGTLGGEIDINVSKGSSYLAIKKDNNFLKEEFAKATKKGFEGFLITEENPQEVRRKYKLQKTPIAWINQIDNEEFKKEFLDENSEIIDPLEINKIISYVDNFLEQATSPFIMIDLNLIFRTNSFQVSIEFLQYISRKSERYNGIFISLLNEDILKNYQISELKNFLRELE